MTADAELVPASTAAGVRTLTLNIPERRNGWSPAMEERYFTLLDDADANPEGREAAVNPILFRAELDRLLAMATARGRASDPVVRQRVADLYARCEIMRFLGLRILTGVLKTGSLGPEASISKLYWSEYHQRATDLAMEILGAGALVIEGRGPLRAYRTDDPGAPNTSGSWIGTTYNGLAGTIYAGTSEVQRNILGESVLGLPREPRP